LKCQQASKVRAFRVEGLFVLHPVVDLNFTSVFNLWAQHKKTHFYS
jgi:hypothetical protein